jgi:MFS family permease
MASVSLAPLRHRSFGLALGSSLISSTGTWMQSVALGIYLTATTRDALWLGLITLAAWMPAIVGSPTGGIIGDRFNRQRWIQSMNSVMALTACALAVAKYTNHLSPQFCCYVAAIEGLCGSASWAAWQSLLPDLVGPDEVLAAVSLSSAQFNLGRVIGPLCAGVVLAFGSIGLCFALNAASFVVVVVMFAFVKSSPREKVLTKVRPIHETLEGARVAWSVKGCRNPIIGVAAVALIASPFITLVPAMSILTLHAGKVGTAWLVTAQGVGAVAGALTLPGVAHRTSRVYVLRGSLAAMVVALVAYGLAPNLVLAALALGVLGGAYVGSLTGLNTSVQLHAPRKERTRILALYTLSLSIFYPVGAVIQSAFARTWGVRPVTLVAALTLGVALAFVTLAFPRYWREIGETPSSGAPLLAD